MDSPLKTKLPINWYVGWQFLAHERGAAVPVPAEHVEVGDLLQTARNALYGLISDGSTLEEEIRGAPPASDAPIIAENVEETLERARAHRQYAYLVLDLLDSALSLGQAPERVRRHFPVGDFPGDKTPPTIELSPAFFSRDRLV